MVQPYTSPKVMQHYPEKAVTGEIIVFGTKSIIDAVTGIEALVDSNEFCNKMELRDTSLHIPVLETPHLINGVVSLMGDAIADSYSIRSMVSNLVVIELSDPSSMTAHPVDTASNREILTDACEHLLKQLLDVYDITHSRHDGRHSYELLRLSRSGTLVVCRFSVDSGVPGLTG